MTLEEFKAFAAPRLAQGLAAPELFQAKLKEVFDFAIENEASMDAEANAYFDRVLDAIATTFEHGLAGVADSPQKRHMLRLIALTKRKHHRAEGFLEGLGRPIPKPYEAAEAGKPIFLGAQQSVLDLLFDVTRKSQTGVAQFATLSMLYWTVDELTVAFYLAERKYATRAYSHLRTVHDLLDKAELFFRSPEWAEVWRSDDKKKIIKELSPGAVRSKLGKPRFDPLYDFLTERGMHGTVGAVKKRVVQRVRNGQREHIAMWIGGVAWDEEVDISASLCICCALLVLEAVARTYRDRLHPAEASAMLDAQLEKARGFLQTHLVIPLQKSGEEVSGVLDSLRRFTSAAKSTSP